MPRRFPLSAATLLRLRAELRSRRLQAMSVVLLVTLAMTLAGLGLVALASITGPFDRLFSELHGAHVWLYLSSQPPDAAITTIKAAPNVVEVGNVEQVAYSSVVVADGKLPAYLQSYPTEPPAIGRILIADGAGLATDDPNGVVLDKPFADAYGLRPGNALTIVTSAGLVQTHVRGLAVDVNHNTVHDGRTAHIFALRSTLEGWFPDASQREGMVGIRLVNPNTASVTAVDLVQRLHAQQITASFRQDDWLSYRASFGGAIQFAAVLLLAFGAACLLTSGMIVANLIAGQVLAQRRDIGVLKAIGFTPWQMVRALALEYLALGGIGGIAGLVLATTLAPLLMERIGAALGVPVLPQYNVVGLALLLLAVLAIIALSAAVPAWQAGHVRVASALRPDAERSSWPRRALTRISGALRLSPVTSVGLQSIVARPLRALLVALTLLVGVMSAVFGLGLVATLNAYQTDPAFQGAYSDVHVAPDLYDPAATQRLITMSPEVASYYTSISSTAQVAGTSATSLNLLAVAGATDRIASAVSQGRWLHAGADEAVVNGYTLQTLGLHLGGQLPLTLKSSSGQSVTISYTVVGALSSASGVSTVFVSQKSYAAHVVPTSDQLLAARAYEATLRPGIHAQDFVQALLVTTQYRVDASAHIRTLPSILAQLPKLLFALSAVLMVIAGVSVFNAVLLSTRERFHELGVLKSLGFTPRQIVISVTAGMLLLALCALAAGVPLGLWLTDIGLRVAARSQNFAAITVPINWSGLVLLVPATCALAALSAWIPARRASRISPAEVLRYE